MQRDLPSGTVTFLFTDIEGSTRLLHEHGQRYAELLAEHRHVLRDGFARHGGVEVDTQGDAFFVAFPEAAKAVAVAAEVQAALEGPVRVRIGIHTGEPTVTEEGYVGGRSKTAGYRFESCDPCSSPGFVLGGAAQRPLWDTFGTRLTTPAQRGSQEAA